MVYPPGQGRYGEILMRLRRQYLEQSAANDGDVEAQVVVAAYHSAEIFGLLSLALDRNRRFRKLVDQRMEFFREGARRAQVFGDRLVTATFTLYNHLNTLCHQFSGGHDSAKALIQEIDEQIHAGIQQENQIGRSAEALRASFPLLGLMTLYLRDDARAATAVRQVEERFAAGSGRAVTEWDHLLNALYRLVEMMQLFVALSDSDLNHQAQQIATHFQEEDRTPDLQIKLRNGFCRLFELGHLITTHLDTTIPE